VDKDSLSVKEVFREERISRVGEKEFAKVWRVEKGDALINLWLGI
jgi:hypothetical protein